MRLAGRCGVTCLCVAGVGSEFGKVACCEGGVFGGGGGVFDAGSGVFGVEGGVRGGRMRGGGADGAELIAIRPLCSGGFTDAGWLHGGTNGRTNLSSSSSSSFFCSIC